jgi:hypothetical protein
MERSMMEDEIPDRGRRWHRWLLALPFIWQVGMVPVVNDVAVRPFSLPFPMVWQMAGVIVTTVVIAIVFTLDRRLEPDEEEQTEGSGH